MSKHMWLKRFARGTCLAVISLGGAGHFSADAVRAAAQIEDQEAALAGDTSSGERSYTQPSHDVDLDFSAPGLVVEVNVKEGDVVKKGQVLAKQDVSVETANKAIYEIEANSDVEEVYAQKDLELKRVKFQRFEGLAKLKNATFLEVEEARLEAERAEASVTLASQKRAVAAAQAATEQAKIDLKQIRSPIDGIVAKLDTQVGEVATNQADKPAFRIVRNDPLWIDADLPEAVTARLTAGQALQVRYTSENNWIPARVLYLQPVVESGSQTRMVRLQLANADERPAGLEVFVKLPDGSVASGARAGDDSAALPRAVADR